MGSVEFCSQTCWQPQSVRALDYNPICVVGRVAGTDFVYTLRNLKSKARDAEPKADLGIPQV